MAAHPPHPADQPLGDAHAPFSCFTKKVIAVTVLSEQDVSHVRDATTLEALLANGSCVGAVRVMEEHTLTEAAMIEEVARYQVNPRIFDYIANNDIMTDDDVIACYSAILSPQAREQGERMVLLEMITANQDGDWLYQQRDILSKSILALVMDAFPSSVPVYQQQYQRVIQAIKVYCDVIAGSGDVRVMTWASRRILRLALEELRPDLCAPLGSTGCVQAEAWTDDAPRHGHGQSGVRVVFNAASWFASASDAAIIAVIGAGFTGEPARAIVHALAGHKAESSGHTHTLNELLDYAVDTELAFTAKVDRSQALSWIRARRPCLQDCIDDALGPVKA